MLSNIEKIEIINQHLRSVAYAIYNAELDRLEATVVPDIDTSLVAGIDDKIEKLSLKKSALEAEKLSLEE